MRTYTADQIKHGFENRVLRPYSKLKRFEVVKPRPDKDFYQEWNDLKAELQGLEVLI